MITVVDYGAGNLRSVANTLEAIGAQFQVTDRPEAVSAASQIILPGVGHFGQMVQSLNRLGLHAPLLDRISAGVPLLGICVGLQCLFDGSEEAPGCRGFGVFPGTIKRFAGVARVPHMGWNTLDARGTSRLLCGIEGVPYAYFAHSYYAPLLDVTVASCDYGMPYSAIIEQNNVYAVQFHPEKSGPFGLRVIRNFVELAC